MYLSQIEIFGFKSFAQHVDLKFDSGITAIVGPNGCGKTNIVDAIRWVLGEQRYGALRSDKMEDLIFNGTKNRKPLSMSEVSLVIENSKHILPTDYAEVTVTRRVYRSGESEYLLNKTPCRLKDIIDLFMDTGIGADAYSVIELKMIETILSEKADERRRLFEEAAGVTKYKHRRKAAYRKLESVQQDLLRVNDIVKEVQKTVNSLERQARRAEQYNEVSSRLKMIEIDLLEREYAYLHERIGAAQEKLALATADKSDIDRKLAELEEQLEQLRQALAASEQQFVAVQGEIAVATDRIHQLEDKALVANERRTSLQDNIERWEKERIDLRVQQEKLHNAKLVLTERAAQGSMDVAVAEDEYRQKRTELQAFEQVLAAKKTELQRRNDEAIALIQTIGERRSIQEKLKSRAENLRGRIERAGEDNDRYTAEIRQLEERVHQLTAEDRELRKKFVEAEMHLFQQESLKRQLHEESEALQHKSIALKTEIERKTAKLDFLRSLIEGEEGSSEGAKFLLSQPRWQSGQLTSVADVVSTDAKYRVAIEAALGDAATYLIVQRAEDAFAAAEDLRKNDKGKATFIILNRVPRIRRRKPRSEPGVLWACGLIRAKEPYRSLLSFLLDGYAVAGSLEEAKRVISDLAGVRCVTVEGEIVGTAGVVRGGGLRQDEGGFIGKREQVGELEADVARLKSEFESVRGERASKLREYEALDLKPHRDAVKAIERDMTAVEMRIAQVEFEKKRANDSIERNLIEVADLNVGVEEARKESGSMDEELSSLERAKLELESQTVLASGELEALEREWEERSKRASDLEIKLVTLQGEQRNIERELEYTQNALLEGRTAIGRRDQDIADAHKELGRLASELEATEHELQKSRGQLRSIEERKRDIEKEYAAKKSETHELELKLKDDRRLHDESLGAVHDIEMKVSEITSNIQHLRERARTEFELELKLRTYTEDEWVDFAARREEVKQLKEKIRAMGAINFAAFDEFKTESERLNFLTQQREDLLEAERVLLSTIEEINNTAQKKFLDTFALIRENFIKTFQGLFDPGDECDLRLEEGADPLEAAIEIIAKPRGKRPTSIDLLSGGEKTLTAIALLFAIYLVKPSPFCILDEVDAPLDDSNIDRFTRILRSFSDNTQFIVVTHNKRTMEAANALYGVTMEEEGVSKIVTVRFTEEARVGSAAIASGL
jgi:chromosome segregation protein